MKIKRGQKIAIILAFLLILAGCAGPKEDAAETRFFGMDTDISITAYGKNSEDALKEAQSKVTELESLWSVTEEGSDIYEVNHSRGRTVSVHRETAEILSFALDMAERTGGALEPTIYPVLTAWGFTTGENRVPKEDELEDILQAVGYGNVKLSQDEVTLPDGMELDLGAVGEGVCRRRSGESLKRGRRYLCAFGPGRKYPIDWNEAGWGGLEDWPA